MRVPDRKPPGTRRSGELLPMGLRGSPSVLRGSASRNRGRHRNLHRAARALACILPPDGAIGGLAAGGSPLSASAQPVGDRPPRSAAGRPLDDNQRGLLLVPGTV